MLVQKTPQLRPRWVSIASQNRIKIMTIENDFLVVSIHDFKTNLSKYIRQLQRGDVRGVVVRRYKKPLAIFAPIKPKS